MATKRHFKFINSKTGNAIHYCSCQADHEHQLKQELEKIKEQVATQNGIFSGTIYWEEVTDIEKRI